jgi:long-subunit acyl-CoA synthetase (AMP-forming)
MPKHIRILWILIQMRNRNTGKNPGGKPQNIRIRIPNTADQEENLGKHHTQYVQDMDVTGAVLRDLAKHARLNHLERFETPGAITLVADEWTPESGLVTAAQKLKRKPIQERYQQDLDRMYKKI